MYKRQENSPYLCSRFVNETTSEKDLTDEETFAAWIRTCLLYTSEILQIAVEGAKLLQQLTEEAGAAYRFEYSPESFTGTEPEYALEVCNAVLEVWKPTADRKAIINQSIPIHPEPG